MFILFCLFVCFVSVRPCAIMQCVVLGVRMNWVLILGTSPPLSFQGLWEKLLKVSEFSFFADTNHKPINNGHCEDLRSFVPTVCVGQALCTSGTETMEKHSAFLFLLRGLRQEHRAGARKGRGARKVKLMREWHKYYPTKAISLFRIVNKRMSNSNGS